MQIPRPLGGALVQPPVQRHLSDAPHWAGLSAGLPGLMHPIMHPKTTSNPNPLCSVIYLVGLVGLALSAGLPGLMHPTMHSKSINNPKPRAV